MSSSAYTPSIDDLSRALGWYGKLPAAGDFVRRRLSSELVNWWHRWLELGLPSVKEGAAKQSLFFHAPIWNFALPASHGCDVVQLGCVAPSRDRVGRLYPLLVSLYVPPSYFEPQLIAGSARFYQQIGKSLLQAVSLGCSVEQFDRSLADISLTMTAMLKRHSAVATPSCGDDILSILNEGHSTAPTEQLEEEGSSWPNLANFFEPQGSNSYWWTNQATGAALRAQVHGGAPNAALFKTLFLA
ncbi:type VI secretion system-associated protein TagF [Oligella urethralis]|uniref:type VI secretion system-associated protein TagF n=1 Tax=Oligella urethralis TaxID=90245 RepID=UPI000D004A4A|nr:type VI secretion system-associated protein TagF [Oligella urethralis]AVL72051.1 type VI secretion system-associated protein TagF [Oligella urethralis]